MEIAGPYYDNITNSISQMPSCFDNIVGLQASTLMQQQRKTCDTKLSKLQRCFALRTLKREDKTVCKRLVSLQ